MDPKLIAKILPRKKDGKNAIGTGYPIGKDLVLTARHVLFPHWNDTEEISIEWPELNFRKPVTELVFDGGNECDIAVVRCDTPPQAHVSPWMLARQDPNPDRRWGSLGYSRLGKDEEKGTRTLVSALGEFHPPNGTHSINLTSKSDAEDKNNWKGMSGAPIFQAGILYAVIAVTPENREECFTATYIPYLLETNEEFQEKVGIQHIAPNFKEAISHLQSLPDVRSALLGVLGKSQETKDSAEALVSCLVKLPIPTLITTIRASQKSANQKSAKSHVFDGLKQLVRLLLPSLYGFDRVTTIRESKGNVSAGILKLPYATEVSAEMLMAAADKRAADFTVKEQEYGTQVRAGKYRLPLAPEVGPDDDNQAAEEIENDLYNRLCAGADIGSLNLAIDEHLFKINPRKQQRAYSQPDKRKLVSGWLEREARKESPSFYWLFTFGDNDHENKRLEQFARELKIRHPHIQQLSLDCDVDQENDEYDLFDQLAETQQRD